MPLDVTRLFASEFHALSGDDAWRAGVTLWLKAWHQVPAGSLPDDDIQLARLSELGRDVTTWKSIRDQALRGWILADDGRLYHPVVCEKALEAWLEKLVQRISSGAGNAKRWGSDFDHRALESKINICAEMLAGIAPHSKAIAKAKRRHSQRDQSGSPDGNPKRIPSGSQGTGILRVKPKGKPLVKKQPIPIPDDWAPSEFGAKTQARSIVDSWSRIELERQIERFQAHHLAAENRWTSWQAAWAKWVLNSVQFDQPRRQGSAPASDRIFRDLILTEAAQRERSPP